MRQHGDSTDNGQLVADRPAGEDVERWAQARDRAWKVAFDDAQTDLLDTTELFDTSPRPQTRRLFTPAAPQRPAVPVPAAPLTPSNGFRRVTRAVNPPTVAATGALGDHGSWFDAPADEAPGTAVPPAPVAGPVTGPVTAAVARRQPMTRREARELQARQERLRAVEPFTRAIAAAQADEQAAAQVGGHDAPTSLFTPVQGLPLPAQDVLALPEARPRSRAERREADRKAARQAAAAAKSGRGQRAAITVALVGLGVALINKGSDSLATTLDAQKAPAPATPTAGIPLGDAGAVGFASTLDQLELRHALAVKRSRPATIAATATTAATSAAATTAAATQAATAAARTAAATVAAASRGTTGAALKQMYGASRSGLPWLSGWWAGGPQNNGDGINAAGQWRGASMDAATAYPSYSTWDDMKNTNVGLFTGFGGRLAYGLPLLPQDRRGQWDDVLSGAHDDVFRAIAKDLVANGFGDSMVRVGLEANGNWFPWAADANNADQFKAAFRHVVQVMKAEAPKLTFWFDTAAAAGPLPGTDGRGKMLATLYPGDDVVDGIGMDHYDFYSLVAHTDAEFENAMRPPGGDGLADAVDFARAHKKGFAVFEWGVHGTQGAGDNPFFIQKMFEFFQKNKDVLVAENYFNEPDSYIADALMGGQNPQSADVYRKLWGGAA